MLRCAKFQPKQARGNFVVAGALETKLTLHYRNVSIADAFIPASRRLDWRRERYDLGGSVAVASNCLAEASRK
jgi:hypothetical protein